MLLNKDQLIAFMLLYIIAYKPASNISATVCMSLNTDVADNKGLSITLFATVCH